MNDDTMAVVLACGEDDGLEPLTRERTKAAVPFGGEYRIIDFVLSNCLHSGLRRILVPTSSRAYSLQTHLRDGWNLIVRELHTRRACCVAGKTPMHYLFRNRQSHPTDNQRARHASIAGPHRTYHRCPISV